MPLDRIITIERPVISRDSYGSVVTNYEPLAQVWAEKMPAKGAEASGVLRTLVSGSWHPPVVG